MAFAVCGVTCAGEQGQGHKGGCWPTKSGLVLEQAAEGRNTAVFSVDKSASCPCMVLELFCMSMILSKFT